MPTRRLPEGSQNVPKKLLEGWFQRAARSFQTCSIEFPKASKRPLKAPKNHQKVPRRLLKGPHKVPRRFRKGSQRFVPRGS